jgi:predicted alpha/beta superfamily hydrolase
MKNFFNILSIFFSAAVIISAQDSSKIVFEITADNVEKNEMIFVSGNHPKFGNWDPAKISLNKKSDSLWEKTFWFENDTKLEFKYTRGDWKSEASDEEGSVPSNIILHIKTDTVLNFRISSWKDEFEEEPSGQITGEVRYHNNMPGKNLEARDILVWLPPSYGIDINKKYPVLYMQDGQNLFDPSTSTFGIDWRLDETADSLIKIGEINELIIVGINNTSQRNKEYIPGDTSIYYMKFIVEELKPFIDSAYRTLSRNEHTVIGGSSAGGLISFMTAWDYPEIFSKAVCFSPAFKIDKIDYVDDVVNYSGKKKELSFYIYNGGIGVEQRLQPGIDEMITALINQGYALGKDLIWYSDESAEHNESAWGKNSHKFLKLFFGPED